MPAGLFNGHQAESMEPSVVFAFLCILYPVSCILHTVLGCILHQVACLKAVSLKKKQDTTCECGPTAWTWIWDHQDFDQMSTSVQYPQKPQQKGIPRSSEYLYNDCPIPPQNTKTSTVLINRKSDENQPRCVMVFGTHTSSQRESMFLIVFIRDRFIIPTSISASKIISLCPNYPKSESPRVTKCTQN